MLMDWGKGNLNPEFTRFDYLAERINKLIKNQRKILEVIKTLIK